jgi:hypothetical protein
MQQIVELLGEEPLRADEPTPAVDEAGRPTR